jgi:hypothetical protein
MLMATNSIWWIGIAFEVAILLRGSPAGLLRKYPLFYSYIGCVLVKEIIGLLTYGFAPTLYEPLYWPAELATIVASYAVIIEIFRGSTRHKPGLRRLAQNLLIIVFGLTVAYAGSDFLQGGFPSLSAAILELSRDLRYVEGGVLLVMLWLFVRYRIPLGRNLMGLIIGYSFWVGCNLINLAFWFQPGNEFSVLLRRLLPVTYVITLSIWCVTLWSAQPEPVPPSESKIERDYELLAAKTQAILARMSHRVLRTTRTRP